MANPVMTIRKVGKRIQFSDMKHLKFLLSVDRFTVVCSGTTTGRASFSSG